VGEDVLNVANSRRRSAFPSQPPKTEATDELVSSHPRRQGGGSGVGVGPLG
jgi:hypothetical protein